MARAAGDRRRMAAAAMALVAGVMAVVPAAAASFCVNSEATAQAALSAAATNGETDSIRFRSGNIELSNGLDFTTASSAADDLALTLAGGYNAGCTQRTGTTVLDGNGSVRLLELRIFGPQLIVIDRLTFVDGYDANNGANLYVGLFDQAGGASLRIDNSAFLLGHADIAAAAFDIAGWGTVRFRNNVVVGNSAGSTAAGRIAITGDAYVVGNTITANATTDGGDWALYMNPVSATSTLWLSNNILWGNDTAVDIYLIGLGTINLTNNNIGVRTNPPLGINTGNLSVDPQFASCGVFCIGRPLKRSSPLVDAGVNAPQGGRPTTDFDGNARLVGPNVDIGALELDALFADGFD